MNYPEFVRSRFKSGEKIAEEMTPRKLEFLDVSTKTLVRDADELKPTPLQCELLHAAIGIAGEAGELLDAVRKHVFDGQPLDGENVIEELGDLNFYFEAACQSIGVTREEIEQENQAKLSKRYEGGYSDQQAQERKDKQ